MVLVRLYWICCMVTLAQVQTTFYGGLSPDGMVYLASRRMISGLQFMLESIAILFFKLVSHFLRATSFVCSTSVIEMLFNHLANQASLWHLGTLNGIASMSVSMIGTGNSPSGNTMLARSSTLNMAPANSLFINSARTSTFILGI